MAIFDLAERLPTSATLGGSFVGSPFDATYPPFGLNSISHRATPRGLIHLVLLIHFLVLHSIFRCVTLRWLKFDGTPFGLLSYFSDQI